MTQAELADASGVSQATLSKAESGVVLLEGEKLDRVSAALGCPQSLLTSSVGDAAAGACVFHRKRSSTTVAQAKRARAQLALARRRASALLDLSELLPVRLPRLAPTADGYTTPEDIARVVRRELSLPPGPIDHLVHAFEGAGAAVVALPLGGRRLDALSDWPEGGRPVVLVNSDAPGDRQRFTVAHELGHAIMHTRPQNPREDDHEREADRFAAELLAPAADIRPELRHLSVAALGSLKARWKVSRAMVLYRARELGELTDYQYRRAVTEMSAAGWRTAEPDPLEPEQPRLLAEALGAARDAYGDSMVAARLDVLPHLLSDVFSGSAA